MNYKELLIRLALSPYRNDDNLRRYYITPGLWIEEILPENREIARCGVFDTNDVLRLRFTHRTPASMFLGCKNNSTYSKYCKYYCPRCLVSTINRLITKKS